jgi:hypothetical protein
MEASASASRSRPRQRYRALLREEIAQTLDDPVQVAEELRSLQAALAD